MRLLGVIEKGNIEKFLIQENEKIYIEDETNVSFPNYNLIKNRDIRIGNEDKNGEGVFNFRYGPVSAGVAEAGVFNIKTYGERILSVNIDPSYKKRGMEKLMFGKTPKEAIKIAESVCGNFSFSHSLAFVKALENILSISTDETTQRLRIVALELERIYNHIHLIAKLSKGAAQNVLTSHMEWLFEESLRINKRFASNRFLKGLNNIGAINFLNFKHIKEIQERISNLQNKFKALYSHSLKSWNFIDRIYKTALLSKEQALSIGITGPSLRAVGIGEDLRSYDKLYDNFNLFTMLDGDALSRMEVRAHEIINSCDIVISQMEKIKNLTPSPTDATNTTNGCGVGFVESPSGIVAYYVEVKKGLIEYVYISTPSVFGYKAFADSFVGYIFTDFSFALDSFGINFADCAR